MPAISVFALHARRYIDLGYSPIPRWRDADGKEHFPMEWSKYCHEVSPAMIEQWCKIPNAMIALCCGYGGLTVFDVDTEEEEHHHAILRALPGFQVGRFGSKGFALFTRYHAGKPEKFFNITTGPREKSVKAVEIKGDGQNITVPPSLHFKTGNPYQWFNPHSDSIEPFDELPALWHLPAMDECDLDRLKMAMEPYVTPPRPEPERKKFNGHADPNAADKERRYRPYYDTALRNTISRLSGLSEGRPTELFRQACAIGAGVHHGFLTRNEFEDGLLDACTTNGLLKNVGRHAILATIHSSLRFSENDELPDLGESKYASKLNGSSSVHENGHDTHSDHKASGGVNSTADSGQRLDKPGRTEGKNAKSPADKKPKKSSSDPRPAIQIYGGSLSINATEAEKILFEANAPFYHQAGYIVRPSRCSLVDNRGERVMVPSVSDVESVSIRDAICTYARVEKYDKRNKEWVDCNPSGEMADTVIKRRGEDERYWRTLAGVSSTPIIDRRGRIAFLPGFDEATKVYLIDPVSIDVPDRPTKKDAKAALLLIEELLKEFPFIDDVALAVGLSAVITPMARSAISVAPMHIGRAPAAGTGKSYLFNIMSMIVLGTRCPVIAAGKDNEETEKRVASRMIAGNAIICIDNVNGTLGGDLICQGISEDIVAPRELGRSKAQNLTNRFSFFSTGNNITVADDLNRRTIPCLMDRQSEVPSEHRFLSNPVEMVRDNRSRYVSACLTILKAHAHARYEGSADLTPFNGFDDWSKVVRGALAWLGKSDPVKALDLLRTEDPVRQNRLNMINAMEELFGLGINSSKTVSEMIAEANSTKTDGKHDMRTLLKDTLATKADKFGTPNSIKIGKWLSSFKDVVIEGKRIRSDKEGKPIIEWYIEKVK